MLLYLFFTLLINLNQNNLPSNFSLNQPKINPPKEIRKEIGKRNSLGIKIAAESAIVIDNGKGELLFGKNIENKTPIASISKLMSALVFLDHNPGWDEELKIIKSDYRNGGVHIYEGEIIKIKDLFYNSLVTSSNSATIALARSTGMSIEEFVKKMNEKAKELGMENTSFKEPTGLSANNLSTAYDLSFLASAAFQRKEITDALKTDSYTFSPVNKKEPRTIINTDKLLGSFLDKGDYRIIGAKTGYTEEAGNCLVLGVEDMNGNGVISVVLGEDTPEERFQESKSLAWWGIRKISNLEF